MSKKQQRGGHFHRSNRSFTRGKPKGIAAKQILIVTEGQNTEPQYFTELASKWNLHPHVVHIKPGCEGIPANLVKTALKVQKDRKKKHRKGILAYNLTPEFDETWIVFDTEHAARQNKLHEGVEAAEKHDIKTAHCNPCFEFWLSLHYALKARPMNLCSEAELLFKEVSGSATYSKKAGATAAIVKDLIPRVATAVGNANTLTLQQKGDDFPANPSCSIQDLVYSLHETLPTQFKERIILPPKL